MSASAGTGPNRTAQSDAVRFPSWIHLFLQPDYLQPKLFDESTALAGPETSASPGQIADALLRSMLGNNGPAVIPISTPLSKLAGIGKKVNDATPKHPASEAAHDNGLPLPIPLAAPAAILEHAKKDTMPAPDTNPLAISPAATAPLVPPVATAPPVTAIVATAPVATAPVVAATVATAQVVTAPVAPSPLATAQVAAAPVAVAPVATSPLATSPNASSAQVPAEFPNPPMELAFEARLIPKVADGDAPAPRVSGVLPLKQVADRREPENSAAGDDSESGGNSANSITAIAPGTVVSSRFPAPPAPTALGPAAGSTPQVREPAHAEPALATGGAHVRELTLRIAAPGGLPVDVQVNQRPGEMRVVVRTSDSGMQLSLREDLPQLVNALDQAGFRTETFTAHQPADSLLAPGVSSSGETTAGNSS